MNQTYGPSPMSKADVKSALTSLETGKLRDIQALLELSKTVWAQPQLTDGNIGAVYTTINTSMQNAVLSGVKQNLIFVAQNLGEIGALVGPEWADPIMGTNPQFTSPFLSVDLASNAIEWALTDLGEAAKVADESDLAESTVSKDPRIQTVFTTLTGSEQADRRHALRDTLAYIADNLRAISAQIQLIPST